MCYACYVSDNVTCSHFTSKGNFNVHFQVLLISMHVCIYLLRFLFFIKVSETDCFVRVYSIKLTLVLGLEYHVFLASKNVIF